MQTLSAGHVRRLTVWTVERGVRLPRLVSAYPLQENAMREHDRVVLAKDLPEYGLRKGDIGTIVHVYQEGRAYEVEFVALTGRTVAVVTVPVDQARSAREDEIAHARPMPASHLQ